ncbi:DUF7146 domain-containing protein [Loktanella salsilacus]|uniref:DUF7146 domain-containing protein n=1 Tax=Loktanella salsilacus TaxID=195913 RepID=UPI0020B8D688|nr:toprim domain-containing protein [Loktanella salsilacus]UTH46284.1 toprim domain-containing protein [Loktanella salsilacus]
MIHQRTFKQGQPHDRAFRDTVKDALLTRAEDLFRKFIGEPVHAGSHDWRPRGRTSFSMKMRGAERGLWKDFVSDEGGDVFDFVAVHLCGLAKACDDFPAVLRAAANWSGVSDQQIDLAALKTRTAAHAAVDRIEAAKVAERKAYVVSEIFSRSQPVADTPAARYLASRGIVNLPETVLSYLPSVLDLGRLGLAGAYHPSLVICATNKTGMRTGGQRILVTLDGSRPKLSNGHPGKPAFGAIKGTPFKIPARVPGGPLCVAEGPESALSVWQATGYETWAIFGAASWKSAPLPSGRKIILCPDQDASIGTYPDGSVEARNLEAADRAFAGAVADHVAAGLDIWIARAPEPAGSKRDLNDTLQRAGNAAVAEAIAAATSARPAPFHPAPDENRDVAIAAHAETVTDFFKDALTAVRARQSATVSGDPEGELQRELLKPGAADASGRSEIYVGHAGASTRACADGLNTPRVMLTGAQGVGKTRALIKALKNASGAISLILQPDHGMAGQFVKDCNSVFGVDGPSVVHLRGRSSQDPNAADGVKMCLIAVAAESLAKAGSNVRSVLCTQCRMANLCGHMKQEATIERLAQEPEGVAIVAPHEYAFLPLPGGIKPDLVVMDEAPRTLGFDSAVISYDVLAKPILFGRATRAKSKFGQAAAQLDAEVANADVIQPFREALSDAFREHAEAPLQALRDGGYTANEVQEVLEALRLFDDQGLTAQIAATIESHELSSRQGTKGGDLESDLSDLIEKSDGQGLHAFRQVIKSVLVELNAGRPSANSLLPVTNVKAAVSKTPARPGIRALFLKSFFHGENIPFLLLDGTGDHTLMERLFGPMRHACHRVERNTNTTQIMGRTFSVQSITGQRADGKSWDTAGDKRQMEAAQLRSEIIAFCHRTPDALVIGPLKVMSALRADGLLNPVAHHGALRGRNDWEQLDAVIMISREQPTIAVEDIARAYAAAEEAPFQSLNGAKWAKQARVLRMRSGPPVTVDVDCHPDPLAERILRQLRDASLCQGIDRIRPIYKKRPVDVTIMASVALDITIDQTQVWVETKRGGPRLEQAVNAHGVIPLSGREAERLMPGIFPSYQTAQRDLEPVEMRIAALLSHSPNNTVIFGNCDSKDFTLCTYQLCPEPGKRMRRHDALVMGSPDEARAILEALTGPLQLFETSQKWEAAMATLDLADTHARHMAGGLDTTIAPACEATPPTSHVSAIKSGQRKGAGMAFQEIGPNSFHLSVTQPIQITQHGPVSDS